MRTDDNARLEDYGVSRTTTPEDRRREYDRQSDGMRPKLREKFWCMVREKDPDVARLLEAECERGRC